MKTTTVIRTAALAAVLAGVISACGGGGSRGPEDDAAASNPAFLPARDAYRANCAACHAKDGRGAANLFPPLRGSEWANGDSGIPIRVVLHGLRGTLTVNGKQFMNQMPPLGLRLDDGKIAEILTYVRASWGNSGGEVTEAEVAAIRAATADRRNPYQVEEIEALRAASEPGAPSP